MCATVASFLAAAAALHGWQATPRPRITGIDHVTFRASDAAAARRFYQEVIGLSERHPGPNGRLAFAVGLHQQITVEPGLAPGEDERLSHLAFATPDVKALAAYLGSRGIDVRQPSERCHDAAIRVVAPDGHTIEFVQTEWPEAAPAGGPGHALSSRILHAGLLVRDEQKAHAFYRDVLGFSEIWRGGRVQGTTSWVNMRVPDGTDYLEYMLAATAPDRRQRGVLHHACLRVADIQAAWETVAARTDPAARTALSPPNLGVNGRWQLNLYDPDGSRIELMEPFLAR